MSIATAQAKREVCAALSALSRAEATLYAEQAIALAAVEDLWTGRSDPAKPYLALEVSMALQVAQSTAVTRMRLAQHLVRNLPATLERLRAGELTVGQGRVIVHETLELPDDTRAVLSRQVEGRVLPRVAGMTPSDTRREVRAAILSVDELAAERRRNKAKDDRAVWDSPRQDGRAMIGADLSAEDAGMFLRALGELADATFDATDPRSADQQRADLFTHLPEFALAHLHGEGPGWLPFLHDRDIAGVRDSGTVETPATTRRRHKRIQAVILVPVETALDLRDGGAQLLGYGPVTGAHARELLATAELRKACTDRYTGRMIALDSVERAEPDDLVDPDPPPRASRAHRDAPPPELRVELALLRLVHRPSTLHDQPEPQHDPSPALTDLIRLRDQRCTAPGCSMPASRCHCPQAAAPRSTGSPTPTAPPARTTSAWPAPAATTPRPTAAGPSPPTPTAA